MLAAAGAALAAPACPGMGDRRQLCAPVSRALRAEAEFARLPLAPHHVQLSHHSGCFIFVAKHRGQSLVPEQRRVQLPRLPLDAGRQLPEELRVSSQL